jgi:hypothetical protein
MMSYMYNHILNSHYSHANPWVGELANLPLYHEVIHALHLREQGLSAETQVSHSPGLS